MRRSISVAATVLAALLASSPARAQQVTITLGPQAAQAAQRLGVTTAQLESLVKGQVSALYGLADVKEFLRLSANAQSMANKGLAVDYTSSFDTVLFGFGVDAAVAAGSTDLSALKGSALGDFDRAVPVAAGVQLSLLAGVHITGGLYAFVNGLAYPISVEHFESSGYNVGAHLQYRLGSGVGSKVLAQWGGVALTAGVELSHARYALADQLDAPVPLASDFDLLTSSTGKVTITQEALTLPVELTTSLRVLYFVTVYGGAGLDVQLGKADFALDIDSKLTGQASTKETFDLGTAKAVFDGSNDADKLMFRLLGGLEVNFGPAHVFAQANVLTKDLTVGIAGGLRVGF